MTDGQEDLLKVYRLMADVRKRLMLDFVPGKPGTEIPEVLFLISTRPVIQHQRSE